MKALGEDPRTEYGFLEFYIRADMLVALKRYVEHHEPVGGFLTAVICNDLSKACGQADMENLRNLPAFSAWLYNEAPSACWGSREKHDAWLALRGKVRS